MMQMMPISEQFFRQCGKKLMQPKARLVNEGDDGYLLIRRGKTDKRLARVSTAMLAAWRKADFVDAEGDEFVLSATGRAHLRRQSGDFIAQHRLDLETGDNTRPRQLASTPLQWLQARGRSKALGLMRMNWKPAVACTRILPAPCGRHIRRWIGRSRYLSIVTAAAAAIFRPLRWMRKSGWRMRWLISAPALPILRLRYAARKADWKRPRRNTRCRGVRPRLC